MSDKILFVVKRGSRQGTGHSGTRGIVTVSHIKCYAVNFVVQNNMQATVSQLGAEQGC